MKVWRLLVRVVLGALFVGHGTQKLFGWFGGHGIEGTAQFLEQVGLRPGKRNAIIAGAGEAGGGALLAAGFLTPLGAAGIAGAMLTAVQKVHLKNGPWVSNGGYEYNLVVLLAVLALVEAGPGPLSLDAAAGRELTGTGWALAALIAGGLGAAAVEFASEPAPEPALEPDPQPAA